MTATMQSLPLTLSTLRETLPPASGVLSAYLDTSPDRLEGLGYLLAFRDGCKALRRVLTEDEAEAFEAAVARVESYLTGRFAPHSAGLAFFASGWPAYFHVVPLPARPAEDVTWGKAPELSPLEDVLDEFERIAVLLFDKERARLLTVFLGEVEERHTIEDEVPGKQATGGWFALAQSRYARHHEDHVLRHAKRTIRLLQQTLRTHPFDRLLIGGPPEAVSLLRQQLPRPMRARLAGTLNLELFATENEVRQAALRVAAQLERREELAMVDELLEQATADRVMLGLQATLDALNDGRVHQLVVAKTFAQTGAECPTCRRLAPTGGACPHCGAAMTPVDDLRERVVGRALAQGGRIESVAGEAAAQLARYDGIGAWTRF